MFYVMSTKHITQRGASLPPFFPICMVHAHTARQTTHTTIYSFFFAIVAQFIRFRFIEEPKAITIFLHILRSLAYSLTLPACKHESSHSHECNIQLEIFPKTQYTRFFPCSHPYYCCGCIECSCSPSASCSGSAFPIRRRIHTHNTHGR